MTALLFVAAVASAPDPFAASNLVAWCVVPFDAKKRTPDQRVALLKQLGFTKYAYDWRAEHLPTFDRECELLKEAGIELTAVWFPAALNADAEKLLAVIDKHGLHPQLWVMPSQPTGTQEEKVSKVADQLRPVAEAAAKRGCKLAIYNHGGWAGEPENMLAVRAKLDMPHVGLVYNLHHGHAHLDRFPELLKQMAPHLLALNLNGMTPDGDKKGQKVLVIGHGERDEAVLAAIRGSGYSGTIGVLGHTGDDVELRLRDNLDGLRWLLKKDGPRPTPRTKPGQ